MKIIFVVFSMLLVSVVCFGRERQEETTFSQLLGSPLKISIDGVFFDRRKPDFVEKTAVVEGEEEISVFLKQMNEVFLKRESDAVSKDILSGSVKVGTQIVILVEAWYPDKSQRKMTILGEDMVLYNETVYRTERDLSDILGAIVDRASGAKEKN